MAFEVLPVRVRSICRGLMIIVRIRRNNKHPIYPKLPHYGDIDFALRINESSRYGYG